VPLLVDVFGMIVEPATDWLIALTVAGKPAKLTLQKKSQIIRLWFALLHKHGCLWTNASDKYLRLFRNDLQSRRTVGRRMEGRDADPDNINYSITTVLEFYRWAQEHRLIDEICGPTPPGGYPLPFRLIRRAAKKTIFFSPVLLKKARDYRRDIPTESDMDVLYVRLSSRRSQNLAVRDCLIADWAVEVGLRRAELLSLQISQIPSLTDCEKLRSNDEVMYLIIKRKNGGHHKVAVLPELLLNTRRFIDRERHQMIRSLDVSRSRGIFISQTTGSTLSGSYVSRIFRDAFGRTSEMQELTLHRLRARFCSKLMQAYVRTDLERAGSIAYLARETIMFKVAEAMGIRDPETLRHYLDEALDRIAHEQKLANTPSKY